MQIEAIRNAISKLDEEGVRKGREVTKHGGHGHGTPCYALKEEAEQEDAPASLLPPPSPSLWLSAWDEMPDTLMPSLGGGELLEELGGALGPTYVPAFPSATNFDFGQWWDVGGNKHSRAISV